MSEHQHYHSITNKLIFDLARRGNKREALKQVANLLFLGSRSSEILTAMVLGITKMKNR